MKKLDVRNGGFVSNSAEIRSDGDVDVSTLSP